MAPIGSLEHPKPTLCTFARTINPSRSTKSSASRYGPDPQIPGEARTGSLFVAVWGGYVQQDQMKASPSFSQYKDAGVYS